MVDDSDDVDEAISRVGQLLGVGPLGDAQLHLLDRQVLDVDGVPVTTVDDIEISARPPGTPLPAGTLAPTLTALLTGPVLGTRIFGGRPPSASKPPLVLQPPALPVTVEN